MTVCSNCHAEQPSSDVTTCILCGYPVTQDDDAEAARADDDSLDFVVTEANGDSRPFIGGQKDGGKRRNDDLGIESTSDLIQMEAERDSSSSSSGTDSINQPIGDSAPPPPPQAHYDDPEPTDPTVKQASPTSEDEVEDQSDKVKKLSEEEIKKIEQNLYGSSSYLKEQEKAELTKKLNSLNAQASGATAAVVSDTTEDQTLPGSAPGPGKPRAPKRGKGIAYFYRNFIQITDQQALMANDICKVNNREYMLRPKKIKTPYVVGGFAVVLAVFLIIIGTALSPSADGGAGRLVGVVLDDNDQPYLEGAIIHIPEKDKRIESDQRGFFAAGAFPVGTYTLEYVMDGHVVGIEQASVTDGEIRMIFLRPQDPEEYTEVTEEVESEPVQVAQATPPQPTQKAKPKPTVTKSTSSSSSTTTKKKSSKSSYAKVTLNANVANARFELDGSVMGAGNLTYSKIKTGRHSYRVSAEGYKPAEGKLSLDAGENHRLSVSLKPLAQAQKAETFQTDDFYYSGTTALQQGDYQTALSDLNQAIEAKPSYAEAYYYRAKAYGGLKMHDKAYDDYIRAAEIYRMRKDYGQAISCYNAAVDVDDRVITAFLGRGDLYLKKGEELAAIADFDRATQIDKRSFQAYYGLGEARFKQQQYKKAIDHFKDARSVNEDDPLVYQYLMLSYMAIAKYKDVKKTYDKFTDVASEEQLSRFKNDQKYGAVIRVIESQ